MEGKALGTRLRGKWIRVFTPLFLAARAHLRNFYCQWSIKGFVTRLHEPLHIFKVCIQFCFKIDQIMYVSGRRRGGGHGWGGGGRGWPSHCERAEGKYKVIGRRVEFETKNENRLTFEHKNNKGINCKKPRTKKKSNYYQEIKFWNFWWVTSPPNETPVVSWLTKNSLLFSPLLLSNRHNNVSESGLLQYKAQVGTVGEILTDFLSERRRRKLIGGSGECSTLKLFGFLRHSASIWSVPFSSDGALQIGGLFHLSISTWKVFYCY